MNPVMDGSVPPSGRGRTPRRAAAVFFSGAALLALLQGGCTIIPAVVSGSTAGLEYNFSQQASRVFPDDLEKVKAGTRRALSRMAFPVLRWWKNSGDLNELRATAKNRVLVIRLESISHNATRVQVDARHENFRFVKDKPLAVAMVEEIERILKAEK